MTADLSSALRNAIIANTSIATKLSAWQGSPAVFTRQPIPEDATFPCVVIPYVVSTTDQDFITSDLAVMVYDIMVYGNIAAPGTDNDDTRTVDAIGFTLRDMFHRKRIALGNTPYHVVDIVVNGPNRAPVDDDKTVGRMVTLTLRVQNGS